MKMRSVGVVKARITFAPDLPAAREQEKSNTYPTI